MNNNTLALLNSIAVKELNDEVAVTCSGGVFYKNGSDPDVILYRDPNFQGGELRLNASTGDGDPNIGIDNGRENGFKDQTSSIRVLRGIWNFFESVDFKGWSTGILSPGNYNNLGSEYTINSAFRVG